MTIEAQLLVLVACFAFGFLVGRNFPWRDE